MNQPVEGELIPFDATNITVFDPFQAQLDELEKLNSSAVFDYEDKQGNKDARSHVFKIRKTKSAIENARKAAKQASLDYGRAIDAKAKEITAQLEGMILVHQKPIDEIEQREKDRIAAHQEKLEWLRNSATSFTEHDTSAQIKEKIQMVEEFTVDDSLEEFEQEAATLKAYTLSELNKQFEAKSKAEAEKAELDRLRREEEERQQKAREEQIRQEAEDKAKREAEEKAEQERQAAAQREQDLKDQAERAEREAEEARQREAQAAEDARKKAIQEQQDREAAEKSEREAREADDAHRQKCGQDVFDALVEQIGISESDAVDVLNAIVEGKLPRVTLNF